MKFIADIKHLSNGIGELFRSLPSQISDKKQKQIIFQRAFQRAKDILTTDQYRLNSRYAAGADKSRLRDDWTTTIRSMSSLVASEWKTLVARSELAMRTGPYAKNARRILIDHIVGSGLKPFPAVKDDKGEFADSINNTLSNDWARFNDECIRNGANSMTSYDAQRLDLGTIIDTGSVLINTVNSNKGSMLPIAFRSLKPLRLDWSHDSYIIGDEDKISDSTVLHGMKLNFYGEPIGYYTDLQKNIISSEVMKIFFYQEESEQYFALPWLTPVLPFIYDLDELLKERMFAARLVEGIALWIKSSSAKSLTASKDDDDDTIPWEPAQIMKTKDKPELIQNQDRVSETFAPLTRLYLHGIASGLGFSHTLLTRDLENVNFASTRFNKIADSKVFRVMYNWFRKTTPQYKWNEFVKYEFITGRVKGVSFTQYEKNPWRYQQCYFLPEGEDWVDPLKDAQALALAYKMGWFTLQDICALKGKGDWKAVLKQRAKEKDFIKNELGLLELVQEDQESLEGLLSAPNEENDDNNEEDSVNNKNKKKDKNQE